VTTGGTDRKAHQLLRQDEHW